MTARTPDLAAALFPRISFAMSHRDLQTAITLTHEMVRATEWPAYVHGALCEHLVMLLKLQAKRAGWVAEDVADD